MSMPNKVDSPVTQGTVAIPPVPVSHLIKTAAADPKTTNMLLLVVVLCMSGLMPEQLNTLCGL